MMKSRVATLLKRWFPILIFRRYHKYFGNYPAVTGKELRNVHEVLAGTSWNMSYGLRSIHHELEEKFSQYVGAEFAISIASGGMGIQASLRAAGISPGSLVAHQVDTCPAVPFSVLNAHLTPKFLDTDLDSHMLNIPSLQSMSQSTSAIIATHMWGGAENVPAIRESIAENKSNIFLIEDCCLALGTHRDGKHVGTIGDVGVFSFGSTKQLQAGEGGMVVTGNRELAKEIRSLRHWGERSIDYHENNYKNLGMNGRMSEFVAAIILAQLEHYPARQIQISENVFNFSDYLNRFSPFSVHNANKDSRVSPTFSQVTLALNKMTEVNRAQLLKDKLALSLSKAGVNVLPGNFRPLNDFEIFKSSDYLKWSHSKRVDQQLDSKYPVALSLFKTYTLGIPISHFANKRRYEEFRRIFDKCHRDIN